MKALSRDGRLTRGADLVGSCPFAGDIAPQNEVGPDLPLHGVGRNHRQHLTNPAIDGAKFLWLCRREGQAYGFGRRTRQVLLCAVCVCLFCLQHHRHSLHSCPMRFSFPTVYAKGSSCRMHPPLKLADNLATSNAYLRHLSPYVVCTLVPRQLQTPNILHMNCPVHYSRLKKHTQSKRSLPPWTPTVAATVSEPGGSCPTTTTVKLYDKPFRG